MIYIEYFEIIVEDPESLIMQDSYLLEGGLQFENQEEVEAFKSRIKHLFKPYFDIKEVVTCVEMWRHELQHREGIIQTLKDDIARIYEQDELDYRKLAEHASALANEMDMAESVRKNIETAKRGYYETSTLE